MLESVTASLIARGLATAGSRGKEYYEDRLSEDFSEDLSELGAEFNRALRDNISETIDEQDIDQLPDMGDGDQWAVVASTLDADLDFTDEDEAIDAIANAILHAAGGEASSRPWIRRNVKQAVAEAYDEAVQDFKQRIAGTNRADLLGFANDQELLNRCDAIVAEIDEVQQLLQRRQYYYPFEATPEGFERARQRLTSEDIEFVNRKDLPDDIEAERLLLYGRKGVGKSRALAELTRRIDADELAHIIVPREGFDSREDIRAIEQESFSGSVLLLWDDIHKVGEEGNGGTVLSLIKKLENMLEDRGYVLRAFITSRAERLDQLPGDLDDPDSFWGGFEQIELSPLNPGVLSEIFDRALEYYDVDASDDVACQFMEKARRTDPSPFYVVSVVGLADDELTLEDIETLPETAIEVWEYQYGQLAEESQRVLLAIKLLSLSGVPFYKSLVEGVYRYVFDRPAPKYLFRNPVKPLLDQQWITLTDSDTDPFDRETEYRVHDIQLEAIQDSVDDALEAFSNYLCTELQSDIPEAESEQRVFIHRRFANTVRERDTQGSAQIATRHYQYILDSIDADDILTRISLGDHLYTQGATEEATEQYNHAIECLTEDIERGRDDPDVYYLRGIARFHIGDHEGAARDFSKAIERGRDNPEVYYFRGGARGESGNYEDAIEDFSKAIERGRDNPEVYYLRGRVRDEYGDQEGAAEDFSKAIERGRDDSDVYYNRGSAKFQINDHEGAAEDFSEAIERGHDDPEVYYLRGRVRGESGNYEDAVEDFSKTIEGGLDNPEVYSFRGKARGGSGDYEGAAEDFSEAIERGHDDPEVYYLRGIARGESGDYEDAVEDFEQKLVFDPKDDNTLRRSAEVKIASGNARSAFEDAREASRLAESNDDRAVSLLLLLIARVLLELPAIDEERDYRTICEREFDAGWDFGILDSWLQGADLTDEKRDRIAEFLDLYREHRP